MGTCACAFVISNRRVFQTVYIFFLRLPARPFLGLVSDADSPPILPAVFRTFATLQVLGLFTFAKVLSNTLAFWKILGNLLRSWGLPFRFFVWYFLEEAYKLLMNLVSIYVGTGGYLHLIFSDLSALLSGFMTVRTLLWRCLCRLLLVP